MTKRLLTTVGSVPRLLLLLSLASFVLLFAAPARAQESRGAKQEQATAPSLARILISFKLDPAITRSQYMGDRWVSPPIYTSTLQPGDRATVEASVRGVDAAGMQIPIEPTWSPADPAMVSVTPADGSVVKITVRGAGESRLRVTSGAVSKDLNVKAVHKNNGTQVEITQPTSSAVAEAGKEAQAPAGPEAPADAVAAREPVLKGTKARNSYAAGRQMGNTLKATSADLDAELVVQGLKDALTDAQSLLTSDEMRAALAALQTDFRTRKTEAGNQIAEKNKKEGESFLVENKTKEGVVTLESGLQYKVLKTGEGPKPSALDTVVCHYRGTFVDGTEFDSSLRRNQPATMALKRVIKGWREALQLMPVGSKWQLFVPPNLAYGARGTRGVGPNATLVFEVELLSTKGAPQSVHKPESSEKKLAKDGSAAP